ncbi:hypothetical protein MTR67_039914 [Solanum verrucosum]|uniref:Uncharacterized protein n=1 Tax=Solanum verrucosum TaxID=315347 RepID=A0AAF0UJW2_SOLVR|nr:hypothetical protein MTR67_039914 [Solanum verrucosum]
MDHHVFLPMDHPWRSNKTSFNGKTELRPPPPSLKGTDVLSLQDFENVFGKKRKRSNDGPWKKEDFEDEFVDESENEYEDEYVDEFEDELEDESEEKFQDDAP